MKKEAYNKLSRLFTLRVSVILSVIVVVIMGLALVVVTTFAKRKMMDNAVAQTTLTLKKIASTTELLLRNVETATRNTAPRVLDYIKHRDFDNLPRIAQDLKNLNPSITGACIAFPDGSINGGRYGYLVYNDKNNSLVEKWLDFDFSRKDWFNYPMTTGKSKWTDPYISSGSGKPIITYTYPITDEGKNIGVIEVDLSIEDIRDGIMRVMPYDGCVPFVVSRNGNFIVHPNKDVTVSASIQNSPVNQSNKVTNYLADTIEKSVSKGAIGQLDIDIQNNDNIFESGEYTVFYIPISNAGWTLIVACPHDTVFEGISDMQNALFVLFAVSLIVLIALVCYALHRLLNPLLKTVDDHSKVENELSIARDIQQNLLSKAFSPYIDWQNLQLYAELEPAREVGGDLYDFFIRDRKLFFCVGDVSGKGIPAALFMAITRGLFRVIAFSEDSPANILTSINRTVSADNPRNMFVTMLCGCLDLDTGKLILANAGHNPPAMIDAEGGGHLIDVIPAVPLGFFEDTHYKEIEMLLPKDAVLFAYTDGVVEAENSRKELFGSDRMLQVLEASHAEKGGGDNRAKAIIESVHQSIKDYAGDAVQSDDIAMLCVLRTADGESNEFVRSIDFENRISDMVRLLPFLNGVFEDFNIDHSLRNPINLAVEEALVNSMTYAYPKDEVGKISLTVEYQAGTSELRFILTDSGMAFDPTSVKTPDVQLDGMDREIGGLGVFLVNQIMDHVEYQRRNQNNILLMTKKIDYIC